MKKQQDSMHVARFLSGLPKSLNPVKSQILANPNLPSLSEVFGRLQQATLSDSSTGPLSPPILMYYLLLKNLLLPLLWGVLEVVVEVEVVGAEAVEVVTKGAMVVNKGVVERMWSS